MAELSIEGSEELEHAFDLLSNIPRGVKEDILNEMGKVLQAEVIKTGEEMRVRDPYSNVHILDKTKLNSPKITNDGGSVTITFVGERKRGKKSTRNGAIAFMNEYGSRNHIPRPFISTAVEKCQGRAIQKGLDVLHDWFKTISD